MRVIRRGLRYTLRGISDFGGDMAAGGESGLPLAGLLARYQTVPLSSGVLQALVPSGGSRRSSIGPSQQPGRCGDFDGLNDYIATNVNPYSLFPNGGTIEFWFNADTIAAGTNRIFTIGTSGGGTRIAAALVGDQVQMLGSGGALLHTTTALTGVWYHVAIATNFNNSHHFYVNGVLIGTATTAWSFADADTFRIAADTQVVVGRHYDGKLSHFRVWGGQLTDEQVRDLYLNGPANSLSRDSLELEYLLENQHSNFVFDSSGAERHGSKIGVDASVGQFHHEGSSVPFSDENERGYTQLAWFDGVDDRIVISNNAVTDGFFPMEDYTLEIEAVRDNFNFQPFFHLSDPDNLNKYIQFKFPNQLMVTFSAGMAEHTATTLIAPYSTAGVGFGQLFTVKAVIRQGFQGLYINDVLMASKDLVGTFVFNDSMLTLGFGQTTGASTAYARSLVKSVKLTDNLTGEVKLHLDFSTLKDGKSIVDSSTGKVYAIEGADSRFMQRIPAATATTDASGGTLTYTGKSPIDAKFKQSWCGNFDGTDDYIQFNNFVDASLLEQGRATVRINADGGYTTIFGFGNTDDSIVVGLDNGMVWLLALQNQYNDFIYKETPAIISNGVEYLIEVSWGNGNYSIKVDGVLQPLVDWSSETISGDSVVLANNTPLVIGADTFGAGSLPFDGQIFDLQIYDKNGDLFSHVPICEGEGSPVAFDVVSGEAGTITAADTSVGGTFWGRQDSYHYNVTNGWSWDHTETFRIPYLASGVPNSTSPYYTGLAPVLSSPSLVADSSEAATPSVSTNAAGGTLYWFLSTSATPPSAAVLKAGTGSVQSGNQSVVASGSQSIAQITGLSAETQYHCYFLHNRSSLDSNIASASATTDPPALPQGDVHVTNQAEFEAVIDGTTTVNPGDVITVAPGSYDANAISMTSQPLNCTWKAYDPNNRPVFNRWKLSGVVATGTLEFDGINFDMPYPEWVPNSAFWSPEPATVWAIILGSSSNITSLTIQNFEANGNLDPWWDGGRMTHNNVFGLFRNMSNVTIKNGTIRNTAFGVTLDGIDGFTIENVTFTGQHADPIALQNQTNHCQDGLIKNCHAELPSGDTSSFHWDCIQFQPTAGSYYIRRIEFVGNTCSTYSPVVVGQTDPSTAITYNVYTASFTMPSTEHGMETRVTPSGSPFVITMPAASQKGEQYCVRYTSGTGNVTFALNGADTYNGGSPPALSAAGQAVTFVSDGAGNWEPLSPGYRAWFLLRDSNFTLGSLEVGLVTKLNAASSAVTATLPADGSQSFHLQCEDATNICKVVAASGDTITIHGSPVSEVTFRQGYGLTLVGDGAGNWTATEEPVTGTFLFGNAGDYEDITIHGNIAFVYGDAVVLQTEVPGLRVYNNTFLGPYYEDLNSDGVIGISEGNNGAHNRIELSGSTAFSQNNVMSRAISLGTYGADGLDAGSINLNITDKDPLPAVLTDHFAGTTRADFLPQTRAEVVASAAVKTSGPLDGTLIGARPYYDFAAGAVASYTPPAIVLVASSPADGDTEVPA